MNKLQLILAMFLLLVLVACNEDPNAAYNSKGLLLKPYNKLGHIVTSELAMTLDGKGKYTTIFGNGNLDKVTYAIIHNYDFEVLGVDSQGYADRFLKKIIKAEENTFESQTSELFGVKQKNKGNNNTIKNIFTGCIFEYWYDEKNDDWESVIKNDQALNTLWGIIEDSYHNSRYFYTQDSTPIRFNPLQPTHTVLPNKRIRIGETIELTHAAFGYEIYSSMPWKNEDSWDWKGKSLLTFMGIQNYDGSDCAYFEITADADGEAVSVKKFQKEESQNQPKKEQSREGNYGEKNISITDYDLEMQYKGHIYFDINTGLVKEMKLNGKYNVNGNDDSVLKMEVKANFDFTLTFSQKEKGQGYLLNPPKNEEQPSIVSASDKKQYKTLVESLRLRTEPSLKGSLVATISEGEILTYLNQKTDNKERITLRGKEYNEPWLKVKYEKENLEGWVYGGALLEVESNTTPQNNINSNTTYCFKNKDNNQTIHFSIVNNKIQGQVTKLDFNEEGDAFYENWMIKGFVGADGNLFINRGNNDWVWQIRNGNLILDKTVETYVKPFETVSCSELNQNQKTNSSNLDDFDFDIFYLTQGEWHFYLNNHSDKMVLTAKNGGGSFLSSSVDFGGTLFAYRGRIHVGESDFQEFVVMNISENMIKLDNLPNHAETETGYIGYRKGSIEQIDNEKKYKYRKN